MDREKVSKAIKDTFTNERVLQFSKDRSPFLRTVNRRDDFYGSYWKGHSGRLYSRERFIQRAHFGLDDDPIKECMEALAKIVDILHMRFSVQTVEYPVLLSLGQSPRLADLDGQVVLCDQAEDGTPLDRWVTRFVAYCTLVPLGDVPCP